MRGGKKKEGIGPITTKNAEVSMGGRRELADWIRGENLNELLGKGRRDNKSNAHYIR